MRLPTNQQAGQAAGTRPTGAAKEGEAEGREGGGEGGKTEGEATGRTQRGRGRRGDASPNSVGKHSTVNHIAVINLSHIPVIRPAPQRSATSVHSLKKEHVQWNHSLHIFVDQGPRRARRSCLAGDGLLKDSSTSTGAGSAEVPLPSSSAAAHYSPGACIT